VSSQKATVQRYTDGFRSGDLAQILSCLTEDVVWALHGAKTLTGRAAFAAEADSARLLGGVHLQLVPPPGRYAPAPGDALVSRLDTFHIWLGEVPAA